MDDQYLLRESKVNPRKTSSDLARDLDSVGLCFTNHSSSTFVASGQKSKKTAKKLFLTNKMKKK